MSLSSFYIFVVLCTVLGASYGQALHERNGIINASLLNSMKEFPHQVGIHVSYHAYCSGSIIAPNWILTAASCVGWSRDSTITLMFKRLDLNITQSLRNNSFTIQVNGKDTHLHTNYNLALIELPVDLRFDTEVAAVALAIDSKENLTNSYAVMPGIKQFTTKESYGKFEILPDTSCGFNRAEICTLGWQNSSTVPCAGTQGGGLLIDWPTAPRLVGVFSAPQSCLSYIKAQYVRISETIRWIESVIQKRIKNDGYF